MTKKITVFQTLLVLFFAGCLVCCMDFSRNIIIHLMEKIIGRGLNDMTKWNAVISGSMSFFACMAVFVYYFMYISAGKKSWKDLCDKIRELVREKDFFRYFTLICVILFVAYFSLIRSNYDYADDAKRIWSGHKSWVGASRYISETLAVIFHTNFYLNDISPITQFIAIFVLAFAGMILFTVSKGLVMDVCEASGTTGTSGATEKSVSLKNVLLAVSASLFAICPFYYENLSYKYDSPYMALAMFFGILPFLFIEDLVCYAGISFVSLILVLSSYQAGNSIYIIMTLFCCLLMFLKRQNLKKIGQFLAVSVACYMMALVIFRLFIMIPTEATINERDTKVGLDGLFALVVQNYKTYFSNIFMRFGNIWSKLFGIAAVVIFPFAGACAYSVKDSGSISRLKGFFASIFVLFLMFFLSFGAYVVIGNTVIADRAFMGFDVLVSVVCIFDILYIQQLAKPVRVVAAASAVCLCWGFIIQATVNGNYYAKQQKYEEFRLTLLLQDLSEIIPSNSEAQLLLDGYFGLAYKNHMEMDNYDFYDIGALSAGWFRYYLENWNFSAEYLQIEASSERIARNPEFAKLKETLPVIKDTRYHTIKGADGVYYVYLKHPEIKE